MTTREVKLGFGRTGKADMTRKAVRLHHRDKRSCIYTFVHPGWAYPTPFPCPQCGVTHIFKTWHLNLDAAGNVTITAEMYDWLSERGLLDDFVATKEVVPRPFAIGLGRAGPVGEQQAPLWQPPDVISREFGVVKSGGNAIPPPADRFRREPDGTWTDLEKERQHG